MVGKSGQSVMPHWPQDTRTQKEAARLGASGRKGKPRGRWQERSGASLGQSGTQAPTGPRNTQVMVQVAWLGPPDQSPCSLLPIPVSPTFPCESFTLTAPCVHPQVRPPGQHLGAWPCVPRPCPSLSGVDGGLN